MSSRGHFVGQIIDDLDAIAQQVRRRGELGQFDLNRTLEDFFKEILNLTLGINLRNLNDKHSNAPGLDLGDPDAKVAYQVTSRADGQKVADTLKKTSDEQLAAYDRIYILAIGERQKTYKLDHAAATRCRFDDSHVIGITDVCRMIMGTDLPTMQAIHRKIAGEQERIRIELQPRINGEYETTVLDQIESFPDVQRSDASKLFRHPAADGLFKRRKDAQKALDAFIDELERLPRMTREFFGWLIDNSDERLGIGSEGRQINADLVVAKTRGMASFNAEIRLLEAWNFIDFEQDEPHRSGNFRIDYPGARGTNLDDAFSGFIRAEEISAGTLFSTMNFAPFGPPPADKN